jgi:hypothetical protein
MRLAFLQAPWEGTALLENPMTAPFLSLYE